MKKLIPLVAALALTFGAVTAFAGKNTPASKATSKTKSTKKKATKS
ncbi:MAG TPA: hypothetical protein VHW09_32170 [Bryobacteraceae bacterium]|jgi:hypothetical protein|nr:hypothetical protein [Bryobacteraceae bacterium]